MKKPRLTIPSTYRTRSPHQHLGPWVNRALPFGTLYKTNTEFQTAEVWPFSNNFASPSTVPTNVPKPSTVTDLLIRTKNGLRDHPLLKLELASRAFAVKSLLRLGLDITPPRNSPGRPPGTFNQTRGA